MDDRIWHYCRPHGRALRNGDVLEIGEMDPASRAIKKSLLDKGSYRTSHWYVQPAYQLAREDDDPIRLTPGLQYDKFTEECRQKLITDGFRITLNADRMGYRMEGAKLELTEPLEMISEAAVKGTVQVPADGNAIILMADRQSVAGYPKIGQVVLADMSRLAQCKPGETIRFSMLLLQLFQHFSHHTISVVSTRCLFLVLHKFPFV